MESSRKSSLVILGAARNVERTLARQVRVFERAFASFRRVSFVIVESDSSDRTLEALQELKRTNRNFHFISLGKLAPEIPLRTHRLVRARNAALDYCRETAELAAADYIAVADWDGVNLQLTAEAVLSCWKLDNWDVVTANQPEGYYDVWALRHKDWLPDDCWANFQRLEKELGDDLAQQIAVSSKRIKIRKTHVPVQVESAFGGLAIYKREIVFQARYQLPENRDQEVCEHVAFHAQLRKNGARIIINPAFVNTWSHDDSLPFFSSARLIRMARRVFKPAGC